MSRRKSSSIRITVSYEGSVVKVYAYDEHTGYSIAEIITNEDPRRKDLEAVKDALCKSLKKGGNREVTQPV